MRHLDEKSKSHEYDQWHHGLSSNEELNTIHLAQWHETALKMAPDLKGLKVAEVGCGRGDFSVHLAKQGAKVTGVDFSEKAIEYARKKASHHGQQVDFQVSDAQALTLGTDQFDVVFSCECIEHVPDPTRALREMFRILKPAGTLILTTENYSNAMVLAWLSCWVKGKPFNSGAGVQPIEHFFVFWQIQKMLRQAGFQVSGMVGSHHVFLLLPRCRPDTFVKSTFRNPLVARLLRPLARHMAFKAVKPKS